MKHTSRLKLIKAIFAIALILMLFIPSSVNHPQIDMRALVTAVGIDYAENGVKASAQIMLPVEGGGAIGSGEVIKGEGRNLCEALENISISLGRKLELAHCGLIVLGREAAEKGAINHLEYLLSSGIISPETNVTLSANQDAQEFLKVLSEYSHKLDLSNLLRYMDLGTQNYSHGLIHFLRELNTRSAASAIPCVKMGYKAENSGESNLSEVGKEDKKTQKTVEENQGEKDKDKNEGESGGGQSGAEGSQGEMAGKEQALIQSAQMVAAFKDGKLINIYGAEETRGLAWFDKDTKQGYVFVDEANAGRDIIKDIPLKLRKKKIKLHTQINGDKPVFTVTLSVKLEAEDRHGLNTDDGHSGKPVSSQTQRAITVRAQEIIASSIYKAFEASRADDADIMLVRDAFFRNNYKDYKRLAASGFDFLRQCDFKVKVKANIN